MRMSPLYLRFFVLKRPTFSAVLCILVGVCTFTACSSRPKPIYIDTSTSTDGSSASNTSSSDESDSAFRDKVSQGGTSPSSKSIEIPYREQGGVKYVKVEVNGMGGGNDFRYWSLQHPSSLRPRRATFMKRGNSPPMTFSENPATEWLAAILFRIR